MKIEVQKNQQEQQSITQQKQGFRAEIANIEVKIRELDQNEQQKKNEEVNINRDIAKQDEFTKALAQFKVELKPSLNNPPKTVEQLELILQEYVVKGSEIFRN